MSVNGSPNIGFGSGEALAAIKEVAAQSSASGLRFWIFQVSAVKNKRAVLRQYIYLFLSLLFVYFLLSALYESYLLHFAVFAVPARGSGRKHSSLQRFFWYRQQIFTCRFHWIMLIGLLAKNAILIVEICINTKRKRDDNRTGGHWRS